MELLTYNSRFGDRIAGHREMLRVGGGCLKCLRHCYSRKPLLRDVYEALDSWGSNYSQVAKRPELKEFISGNLFENDSVGSFKTLKNKLERKYAAGYSTVIAELSNSMDGKLSKVFIDMIFLRRAGRRQYQSFVEVLQTIINQPLKAEEKFRMIYYTISLQKALYPTLSENNGVLVPDEIHRWFYQNVQPQEYFNHYYFLIKNNVLLQSHFASLMLLRLLKGSEMDSQLASFQLFLYDKKDKNIFDKKFTLLYNYYNMHIIINYTIQRGDFRFIQNYFEAMGRRLETKELLNEEIPANARKLMFMNYTNTMLRYARASNDPKLFFGMFTTFVSSLSTDIDPSFIHKPLKQVIDYFRENNLPKYVFKVMALLNKFPLANSNKKFTSLKLGTIVSTLRSFSDVKLTTSYVVRTYRSTKTKYMLNELGLWKLVFDGNIGKLSGSALYSAEEDAKVLPIDVPLSMTLNSIPDNCVLCELYQAILNDQRTKLIEQEYRDLVIQLFGLYKNFIVRHRHKFLYYKVNTSVLRTFMHKLRFELHEDKLAYQLLLDFYQTIKMKSRSASKYSPFGIMLYKNNSLSQTEVNQALKIMEECSIPLDFKTLTTMVLRCIAMNDIEKAHNWYMKIVNGRFQIKNYDIINAAVSHGWKLPSDVDVSTLSKPTEKVEANSPTDPLDPYLDEDALDYADLLVEQVEQIAQKMESNIQSPA
ncbi:Atp22p Ecym_5504 [Eremothecium cymbalariae DBVPG|uniref:Mitochondrial translation factor ATP22 n=1 Tax=Eremothecium cymbalariae (strain CBS 270.75 / DBVPG 7215 / KCTC 17166 / NRRL Y-17582) TaxID=931890 RepID=I6NDV5_ERECY|nr:hypothetical protein Ecym_5504 [Eremothecium cymbalariae DBVPG\